MEYSWLLPERCLQPGGGGGGGEGKGSQLVTIAPEAGVVEPHDRVICELSFSPPPGKKTSLKGCELLLEVTSMQWNLS